MQQYLDQQEIEKIYRKVPRWFTRLNQINSTILIKFLELSNNGGFVEIEKLKESCKTIKDFEGNFNQMCYIGSKNNAKLFEKQDNLVRLEIKVRDFILKTYKEMIKGGRDEK